MKRFAFALAASLAATSAHAYRGEKVSIDAPGIEVRQFLQIIADFTGLDIITSDTVGGTITLRLKEVPWDQALDIVLEAQGLAKRVNGNVVLIAPAGELAAREALAQGFAPLRTWPFKLDFADAGALAKRIARERLLSRRGALSIDERTNTLFVQDVEEVLEDIEQLVRRIDIAPPYPI